MDRISRERRSWNMLRIRSRDSLAELRVRSALHRAGFRYRLHKPSLPGRPDIALVKLRAVVLVHGCYWHQHAGCANATTPSTNTDFWKAKFAENKRRDRRNERDLRRAGWRVFVIWECQTESSKLIGDLVRAMGSLRHERKLGIAKCGPAFHT